MKPATLPAARARLSVMGLVNAPWVQDQAIPWHGLAARRFVTLAITCPAVTSLQHQPFQFSCTGADGALRPHTPDYVVKLANGQDLVVDVQFARTSGAQDEKYRQVADLVHAAGGTYYVVRDTSQAAERDQRACVWHRYARGVVSQGLSDQLMQQLHGCRNGCLWADLEQLGIPIEVAYHLLGRRLLITGPDLQLCASSRLELWNQGEIDDRICFESWVGCAPWRANLRACS